LEDEYIYVYNIYLYIYIFIYIHVCIYNHIAGLYLCAHIVAKRETRFPGTFISAALWVAIAFESVLLFFATVVAYHVDLHSSKDSNAIFATVVAYHVALHSSGVYVCVCGCGNKRWRTTRGN